MKKTGFTLIELLAVIVILAIIALIATPMITNVIDTAREGAAESSALGYVDAIEKQVMVNQVTNTNTFDLSASADYEKADLTDKDVEIKGEVGHVLVTVDTAGAVSKACIAANDKVVYYDGSKASIDDGTECTLSDTAMTYTPAV